MLLFIWKAAFEPTRNLRGRSSAAQLARYCSAQGRMASQLAGLGSQRAIPRCLVRHGPAIPIPTTPSADLPTDRRRRTAKLGCDGSERPARDTTSRYLLGLAQAEGSSRPPALRRTYAARRRQHREIDDDCRSNRQPIELIDFPRCHPSQISERCDAE